MTRERKKVPAPRAGVQALTRRSKMERVRQQHDHTWRSLNPLKEPPKMKHKTTFELVQNADKKKKLEFKITTDKQPPPGFEFVPIGNPDLSQMCKDMSREQDAMIFIVSEGKNPDNLEHHMNRVGYHFRQMIVEQARPKLKKSCNAAPAHQHSEPEPIPQDQNEINDQADAVLRDLFPRIPHTDRRQIIQHAFQKDGKFHGEYRVGMAKELTLARRVQLAAIAHIRHTHTRYDDLLKQTSWANARRAVEKPCLDIIVKWRGDEETGRDQLDEILREVIEISDTEEDSEDETPYAEPTLTPRVGTMPAGELPRYAAEPLPLELASHQPSSQAHRREPSVPGVLTSTRQKAIAKAEKRTARKTQRFRRYAAAAEALAGVVDDQRSRDNVPIMVPRGAAPMDSARRPGSVHTINSSREPTVAARGTPDIEQMPRHFELRTDSQRFNRAPGERIPTIPRGIETNGYASPRPLNELGDHRPKVGHVQPSYSHPHGPLSPVRNGLQDMVLQSIEPASPVTPRKAQDSSRIVYREPQRFVEAPRVYRPIHEPMGSGPRPWSPRVVSSGNGSVAMPHRTDYPPRDFGTRTGPAFVEIDRQNRGEDLRHAPAEYFTDRPLSPYRPTSDLPAHNRLQPLPSERVAHYSGDVPLRTRPHQVVIDDDEPSYRPRQVVEVRRHPNGDYPIPPLRRGEPAPRFPVQEPAHHRDGAEVIYIDTVSDRPRSALDYRGPIDVPNGGLPPFQESRIRRTAATGPRHHVVDAPASYDPGYHREPLRSQQLDHGLSGNVYCEGGRVPLPDLDQPEVRYVPTQRRLQERPDFAPISDPHQDRREIRYYRVGEAGEASETALPPVEYRHDYRPRLVAPSAHDHYMENHDAPLRHYAPEHRMVYVDQ
ncbi:uncharacterized protein F4822DRAFT_404191 [Hypoxylon trugodes]|uniref:uncharacterized protein n=1 Tax=Hypoxylon trugodes TaxID=326681 RepID=UPI00219F70D7|nr:uncharacterized protein F4822DRAFT_404191 [Hypoxylon trugodes]KAI1388863.1 hypothetical protein F4822DRAFT_404191 [Hypoxylon trugodes]